ncbi:unnamed protein product [Prunus armeniaca]
MRYLDLEEMSEHEPFSPFDKLETKWMKLPLEPEFEDQAPRMLRKDRDTLGNTLVNFTNKNNNSLQINFLALHKKLVAWEQNCHEFSTEEKTKCSWGRGQMSIKVGDEEFAKRYDEGKRMGMHAGSKGDLRSNIPWSLGYLLFETCSLPMCWNLPAALYNGPSDFPFVAFVFPAKCWGFYNSLW